MKCLILTFIYILYLLYLTYFVYVTAINAFFSDEILKLRFLYIGISIVVGYSPFCYCYIRNNNIENNDSYGNDSDKSVNDECTGKKTFMERIKENLSKLINLIKKIFSQKKVENVNATVITVFFIGIVCIYISYLKGPEQYFEIFNTQKYKCNVVVSHYNDSAIIMEGEWFQFNSSDGVYKKIKIHKRTYSIKSLKDIDFQYVYFNKVNVE